MPRRHSVHAPSNISHNRGFLIGMLSLTVMVGVGAFVLARSDKGAIDVTAAIMNANSGGEVGTQGSVGAPTDAAVIPTTFSNIPNGGLVPSDPNAQQPEPPPVDTATTNEAIVASSTASIEEANGVSEDGTAEAVSGEETNADAIE